MSCWVHMLLTQRCVPSHGTRANSTDSLPCLICPPLFVWCDAGVRERSLAHARAKHGPLSTAAQLLIDPIQKRWPPAPLPRAGSRQSPLRTKRAEVTLDSRHRCVAGDAAAARHEKVGDRVVNAAGGGKVTRGGCAGRRRPGGHLGAASARLPAAILCRWLRVRRPARHHVRRLHRLPVRSSRLPPIPSPLCTRWPQWDAVHACLSGTRARRFGLFPVPIPHLRSHPPCLLLLVTLRPSTALLSPCRAATCLRTSPTPPPRSRRCRGPSSSSSLCVRTPRPLASRLDLAPGLASI